MPIHIYLDKAKQILDKNFNGRFTVPSVHLYPHQWNWDSAFIAIGYSRYNTDRAVLELKSLFDAQWENGMLPHIVFDRNNLGRYFPEPDFWQTERSKYAPSDFLTSGITQPPIHGYAALKIYENSNQKEKVKEFLKWLYPRLIKLHRYFYLERNPDDNGLIYIRHPWESGMDNSPMWDPVLDRIDLSKVDIPQFKRKDDKIIDPEQRPKDEDYKRYIYLVDLFRKHNYDERKIFHSCPFIVIDPMFNSILAASNEALMKIADIIGEDWKQPEEWYLTTSRSIRDLLYSKEKKIFYAYDYIQKKQIQVETSAGFMPLFGGVASHSQAVEILEYMNSASFCKIHENNCFAIPNYDRTKKDFSTKNYWRGPVWININWMLFQGLKRYKFKQKAEHLEKTIIELPVRFGFYEYFDSKYGTGYGTKDFSWTAALFIDLVYDYLYTGISSAKREIIVKTDTDIVVNRNGNSVAVSEPKEIYREFNLLTGQMIDRYVSNGSVNYRKLRMSPEYKLFQNVAGKLKDFDLSVIDTAEKERAFWINLYNMMVVDFIIRMKVKRSVREVDNFFEKLKYEISGKKYSLKDIEEFFVSRKDREALVSLVRGTQSSPPLRFMSPDSPQEDILSAVKDFVNSSEVMVVPEEKAVMVSELFRWYDKLFDSTETVSRFISSYLVDERKKLFLEKETSPQYLYLFYDWYLNS
ncbi:MGH1-like glycoside hydrolase domain-containing protein [Persephonella sp.]